MSALGETVYVMTVKYQLTEANSRNMPYVYDTIEGAKQSAKEIWGVTMRRITPALWKGFADNYVVSIDKRVVIKR